MSEFIEFVMNHWLLSSAFILVLVLFIINEIRQRSLSGGKLLPQEVVDFMNHQHAYILDIRNQEAFNSGHILGSHATGKDLAVVRKLVQKMKNKPCILVCENGTESPKFARLLKKEIQQNVFYLAGGLNAWKAENLPLTKKD